MKETLAEIIPEVFKALLGNVHTAMPGRVESYDRDNFRADIIPGLSRLTQKNQEIEIPTITDVPVLMYGGLAGLIDIELQKDDPVLLIFMEAGIGGWKSSDGTKQVAPDDLSSHELNNAICIPGIIPDGFIDSLAEVPRVKIDADGTVTTITNKASIVLVEDGGITAANEKGNITLEANGASTLANDNGDVGLSDTGVIDLTNSSGSVELGSSGTVTINGHFTVDP